MSRRERALQNIRAVMVQQDNAWRRENGLEEAEYVIARPEPKQRREHKDSGLSADRFLGTSAVQETAPAPAPTPAPEPEPSPSLLAPSSEPAPEPEIVEVIPNKDNRHSWLYNEVVKAINDAKGNGTNTKVIAVFIPVVQNGKEFEDLPVDAVVELSPVSEEDVHVEELLDVGEPEPVVEPEPSPSPLAPSFEPEPAPTPSPLAPSPEPSDQIGDLLPEGQAKPDPELAEAFQTIEEKYDEGIVEEHAEAEAEAKDEQEQDQDQDGEMFVDEHEVMDFVDENAELLPLPDPAELEAIPDVETEDIIDEAEDESAEEEDEASVGEPMVFVEEVPDEEEESKGEPMTFMDIVSEPEEPEELEVPEEMPPLEEVPEEVPLPEIEDSLPDETPEPEIPLPPDLDDEEIEIIDDPEDK